VALGRAAALALALVLVPVLSSCGRRTPATAPAQPKAVTRPGASTPSPGSAPVATAVPAPAPAPAGQAAAKGAPIKAGTDPFELMDRRVSEAIKRARESAVALEYTPADAPGGPKRMASGVVISDEGDVLSVRIDAPPADAPVEARVASGRKLPAQWVAADPETGLTLLKLAPRAARPAVPAPRPSPRLGIAVLVIGNPFGLAHSVSRGFVAGLNRRLQLGPRQLGGLIQVDASLHPGDSGAMLADLQGSWLGVIRSGLASPAESDRKGRELDHDLGFAIPARDALWVAGQLLARKRVDRAYLGVTLDLSAPSPASASAPAEPDGAVLRLVLADTPAERAGLKSGDRVVALDGRPVHSPHDLTDRLDRTPANAEVTVDLLRGTGLDRQTVRLTFRTARRPPFEPSQPSPSAKTKPSEPRATLPREVVETIERLERRVEELEKEKRESAATQEQQR
jgi:S1-C subfamily serine protease